MNLLELGSAVVDVCMYLGLGVGGLEVPSDESICGVVDEMFNLNTTIVKDIISSMKVIVENGDIDVDVA